MSYPNKKCTLCTVINCLLNDYGMVQIRKYKLFMH